MRRETGIVGREGELGILHGTLRDASAGRGRLALIAGEAGFIGVFVVEDGELHEAECRCRVADFAQDFGFGAFAIFVFGM